MPDLDQLADRLAILGVTARLGAVHAGGSGLSEVSATLGRAASSKTYTVVHGESVSLADLTRRPETSAGALVWSDYVHPRTADGFRRARIQYVDTAGNAWIEFGDVLIDIRGRPRLETAPRPAGDLSGNLFSARRAQVVFALLAWPSLWFATNRQIADTAGVSSGLAHGTLRLLRQSGYGQSVRATDQDRLLEHWAAAFPTGLAPKLALSAFHGQSQDLSKIKSESPVFLSGEVAAHRYLRPTTLTLYTESLDQSLPIDNRWRRDGTHNIFVRRKFWRDPDGARPAAGVNTAPWPLVFADLANSDDPRVKDAARKWKAQFADVAAP